MRKGIFHIHSTFSYDGLNSINSIFRFIKKHNLDFAVITDHDTIKGSIKLAEMVKKNRFKVEVPIAAEHKTNRGDIIVVNIRNEITEMNWESFVKEVRLQNGFIILPHPYDGHTNIDELALEVDAIEVFNGRSSLVNNFKSYLLSMKYDKPKIWASDAHINSSLRKVIIGFDKNYSKFEEAVLSNQVIPLRSISCSFLDVFLSQFKRGIVQKNFKLLFYLFYKLFFGRFIKSS